MLRKVRKRTVKWTTEGAGKKEFAGKDEIFHSIDSLSILRREARVKCRGYDGIPVRAPVTGEARWHRGRFGFKRNKLLSRPWQNRSILPGTFFARIKHERGRRSLLSMLMHSSYAETGMKVNERI